MPKGAGTGAGSDRPGPPSRVSQPARTPRRSSFRTIASIWPAASWPWARVGRRVRVRRAHPGAREADLGARQGQDHIGARAERGPAAARRRVAQHRDLRQPRLLEQRRLPCHALELGECQHALLHAAATRGDQRDQRKPPLPRRLVRRLQTVTRPLPERPAEEAELEGEQLRTAGPPRTLRRRPPIPSRPCVPSRAPVKSRNPTSPGGRPRGSPARGAGSSSNVECSGRDRLPRRHSPGRLRHAEPAS